MIVTLTLNPCVDLNLEVEAFEFDAPLRAVAERKRAGGKAVNVSRCLELLGVESVAVVPLGGPGGMEFEELAEALFDEHKTRLVAAKIGGNTRTNVVITNRRDARQLKVNEQGPALSERDAAEIIAALDEFVGYGDVVACCGSLPIGLPASTYADLVRRYKARGAFVAVDAEGEALRLAIEAEPDVIKPNREELARWAGKELKDADAMRQCAVQVACQAGGLCLATDGAQAAMLASPTDCLQLQPPPASGSPVGAGDAALAGLLAGICHGNPATAKTDSKLLREAFRLAVACGAATASTPDTEMFTPEILSGFRGTVAQPESLFE